MSSIANKVGAGGRKTYRGCLYEYTEAETERGSREVCAGRVESGGDGVHWKKRRRRRRGVVLQWREVRGDCSLCLWERSDHVSTSLRH